SGRGATRVPDTIAQGRALFGDLPRSRLHATARLLGARNRSRRAARPGRALPARLDVREILRLLPDAASRAPESPQARAGPGSGAASRGCRVAKDRGR